MMPYQSGGISRTKKKKPYWKTKTKGGMKRPAVFSPVTSVAVRDFLEHCRVRVLKTETEQ